MDLFWLLVVMMEVWRFSNLKTLPIRSFTHMKDIKHLVSELCGLWWYLFSELCVLVALWIWCLSRSGIERWFYVVYISEEYGSVECVLWRWMGMGNNPNDDLSTGLQLHQLGSIPSGHVRKREYSARSDRRRRWVCAHNGVRELVWSEE